MKRLLVILALGVLGLSVALAQTAEKKTEEKPAMKCTMLGDISVRTIPAQTAGVVMEKAADFAPDGGYKAGMEGMNLAYEKMMTAGFEKLGQWMKDGPKPVGPCFAIYYEDPEKTPAKDLTCKLGFPVPPDAKGSEFVKIEPLPEVTAAVVRYQGPYEGSGDIWHSVDEWIVKQGYETAGPPSEVFIKSQGDNVTPNEFITEIRIPVKKAEVKTPGKEEKK